MALRRPRRRAARPHSLPGYHGWYVALWAVVPALLFLAVWSNVSGRLDRPAGAGEPGGGDAAGLRHAAHRRSSPRPTRSPPAHRTTAFNPQARALAPVYAPGDRLLHLDRAGASPCSSPSPAAPSPSAASRPHFRARTRVERMVMAVLLLASLIAILTTLGIVALAAVRKLALLLDGLAGRVPVRH